MAAGDANLYFVLQPTTGRLVSAARGSELPKLSAQLPVQRAHGLLDRALLPPLAKHRRAFAVAPRRHHGAASGRRARRHHSVPVPATQRAVAFVGAGVLGEAVAAVPVEILTEEVALMRQSDKEQGTGQ